MEDGVKMGLGEIGWGEGGVEWIHLAQDRDQLGDSHEYSDEPSGSGAT
jgi:hypothetical protein